MFERFANWKTGLIRTIFFIIGTILITYSFLKGIEWANGFLSSDEITNWIPIFFVLAMSHELMHALAWWCLGYVAIPIPILIPPILGITLGPEPYTKWEDAIISLSPAFLTVGALWVFYITSNEIFLGWGLLNLFGMVYDGYSVFKNILT